MEFNITNNHIIFISVILVVSFFYIIGSQDMSTESFIIKCNEIHGESNWQVDRLSPWTTYSDEFWKTYPIVYSDTRTLVTMSNSAYSCFNKR